MATKKDQKLMAEFPPVSTEQWEAVINADLKGADYDRKLVWHTREGFNVRPYYRAGNLKGIGHMDAGIGQFPYVRSTGTCNHWKIHQTVTVYDTAKANAEALRAIAGGADAVGFRIRIKEPVLADIDTLMKGIDPTKIEVTFNGRMINVIADLVLEHCEKAGYDPKLARMNVVYDPVVARLTLRGAFKCSTDGKPRFKSMSELINRGARWKKIRFVGITGSNFNNAGATIVQELAFTLAAGHEYIAQLTEAGADVDLAARNLRFIMGVSSNYFMEIAKFRAARMLWATIMKQYDTKCECSSKMRIHAVSSKWNMTVYDPYVNMLRGTTEAMSAAIAGVDSLEVLPFNVLYEESNEFSARIARNVQLLLKHESHFDNVVDPSGGSYYIETLTEQIAAQAWALFKEIEDMGGYIKAFQGGHIQHLLSEEMAKKNLDVSTRKTILLGTNQYPNFGEKASEAVRDEMVKRGICDCGCEDCTNNQECECECGECNCGCNCSGVAQHAHLWRGAQPIEQMRLKVDHSGRDLKVFMLTCGTLGMARARAQFAANFFGVAGFRIIDNTFFPNIAEGVEKAIEAKADIVVMCAADDDYTQLAPEAYKMLDDRGIFVVAGAPKSQPELEAQGIHNYISVKSNVLITLMQYVKLLGIH